MFCCRLTTGNCKMGAWRTGTERHTDFSKCGVFKGFSLTRSGFLFQFIFFLPLPTLQQFSCHFLSHRSIHLCRGGGASHSPGVLLLPLTLSSCHYSHLLCSLTTSSDHSNTPRPLPVPCSPPPTPSTPLLSSAPSPRYKDSR